MTWAGLLGRAGQGHNVVRSRAGLQKTMTVQMGGAAGQGRAGQGRAGQGRAGQGKGRAGQGRAGQGRAGQGRRAGGSALGWGRGRGQGQFRYCESHQFPLVILRLFFRLACLSYSVSFMLPFSLGSSFLRPNALAHETLQTSAAAGT